MARNRQNTGASRGECSPNVPHPPSSSGLSPQDTRRYSSPTRSGQANRPSRTLQVEAQPFPILASPVNRDINVRLFEAESSQDP